MTNDPGARIGERMSVKYLEAEAARRRAFDRETLDRLYARNTQAAAEPFSLASGTELRHMDIGSRNARLRDMLEGFGLVVFPVYRADDPETIDWLQVSAALPENSGV